MAELILHLTTRQAWEQAQSRGFYEAPSLTNEGFIHFSTPAQVVAVANFLYRGEPDLVLLCVTPAQLAAELRYEALGTDEPYPHLYGPLELAAVVEVSAFPPRSDGTFELPASQLPTAQLTEAQLPTDISSS